MAGQDRQPDPEIGPSSQPGGGPTDASGWLAALVLVGASAGAAASVAFALCSSHTALGSILVACLIALVLAAVLAAVARDVEVLFTFFLSLGAGSVAALVAVLFFWGQTPTVVALIAAGFSLLALPLGRSFGTTFVEIGVACAFVLAIAWLAVWPLIRDGVHRQASEPDAPPMQCRLIAGEPERADTGPGRTDPSS